MSADPYAHECQAEGCHERALPWGYEIALDSLTLLVRVCRRHELDLTGVAPAARNERSNT